MTLLLLPPRLNDDCHRVRRAAEDEGWQVTVGSWRLDPVAFPVRESITVYADPLYADVAAAALDLALLDVPPDWLPGLAERWRGRAVSLTTLFSARAALATPTFIKPADDKSFPAHVYVDAADLPGDELLPGDSPVLTAEPVVWEVEYRCFVGERAVVSHSVYMRFGMLAQDREGAWPMPEKEQAEALAFAEAVLADSSVMLPPAIVLDVGRIAGHGWAVIEANAAWGSGLYGCDARAILPVIRRACRPRATVAPADVPWVRPPVTVLD